MRPRDSSLCAGADAIGLNPYRLDFGTMLKAYFIAALIAVASTIQASAESLQPLTDCDRLPEFSLHRGS